MSARSGVRPDGIRVAEYVQASGDLLAGDFTEGSS